ncbi:hypothetical protein IX321_002695 [Bacteroides pyogenes]|nr:hypothetical protein [Bacteroides pyogenes]MBR8758516.1 hypothetical protein [Bacteroides pyogenes]MBR8781743.1 hypothetical protein [Bacteroides pyogenes]
MKYKWKEIKLGGCVKTKLNQRRTFNLKLEHPKKQEKEPYHYSKQSSIRLF